MECVTLSQLPVPQLEPIQQLAPYLSGLDVTEALEDFNKLADLVLSDGQQSQSSFFSESSPSSSFDGYPNDSSSYVFYPSFINRQIHSPGGSSCQSSQWLSSCANSPTPSDILYSASHRHHSSSSSAVSNSSGASWCSSSVFSSSPASVASSINGDGEPASNSTRSDDCHDVHSTANSGSRRKKNATAAERYRRKLKGRKCGLVEELEREQERNAKLRRGLESKMTLYNEFVALLARQTSETDCELATLGSKSLSNVLADICAPNLISSEQRYELTRHLEHFQAILSLSNTTNRSAAANYQQQLQQQQPKVNSVAAPDMGSARQSVQPHVNSNNDSQILDYDFYSDRFLPR